MKHEIPTFVKQDRNRCHAVLFEVRTIPIHPRQTVYHWISIVRFYPLLAIPLKHIVITSAVPQASFKDEYNTFLIEERHFSHAFFLFQSICSSVQRSYTILVISSSGEQRKL